MNVLLIDSSPIVRECIALLLRARKDRVHLASSLEEARAYLATHPVDLVIIEPSVEDAKGMELIRAMRADQKLGAMPLLVLTDMEDKRVILELVELGVSQCLLKANFTVAAFLKRLAAASKSRPKPIAQAAGDEALKSPAVELTPAETKSSLPTTEQAVEALKALKPIVVRTELLERIQEVSELRALSPAVANVMRLAARKETSIDALVKAVRVDHAIALKVIKLANSSAYTRGDPVTSVKDAVVRIGTESIRQAVTNIGIIEQLSNSSALPDLTPGRFWEHAIAVAITAAELARRTNAIEPEQAFTIGLLHDIGRILLAEAIPEQYAQVAQQAKALSLPLEQLEKRMLLMTHAEVAQEAMRSWAMPRELIDPIVYHHLSVSNLRSASPKNANAIAVVALANRLVHALEIGASGNDAVYPTEDFFDALRLPPDAMNSLVEQIPDMTEDLRIAMLTGAESGPAPARFASTLPPLLYVTASPSDAIRLVLAPEGRNPEDRPQLAVVRVRAADERAPLTRKLLDMEKDAGVQGLPLLILSPAGNLLIQENHLQGRTYQTLAAPTTRDRIRSAVDSLMQSVVANDDARPAHAHAAA
ncbi:MAG: HDOD domain-containing protein [Phycisphaerales bacterium]